MGVYTAYLTIEECSIWLREVEMSIERTLDDEFELVPESTMIKLGMLFSPTTDPVMQTWMTSPGLERDGEVVYLNPEGNPDRVTRFVGGYCRHVGQDYDQRPGATIPYLTRIMHEVFDGNKNHEHMITTIIISPEKVSVGHIPHDNDWPPIDAH